MKLKILYSLFIAAIVVAGCTDLNEELYNGISDENYPETDAQASVSHLTSYSALADLFDDDGYWYLTQEITSDEMVAPTRAADWYDGGKWLVLQYHSWSNSDDAIEGIWKKNWEGIQECNKILDEMGEVKSEATLRIKSEVETVRSLYYFWLMDNYGDVPYLTNYYNAPEQPYRLNQTAVFDSLTNTLERDYEHLYKLENSTLKSYATQEMALTLLAKLYLNGEVYTSNADNSYYQKTIEYCNLVLASENLALESDFTNMFLIANSGSSSELIFIIPFNEESKEGFRFHMRSLGYISNQTFNMATQPWNGFAAIPTFFEKYDTIDLRRDFYLLHGPQYDYQGNAIMADDAGTEKQADFDPDLPIPEMTKANMEIEGISNFEMTYFGARVQKYEIYQEATTNLTVNFPVFRLADVVFMKAEAELRLNGSVSSETMAYVQQIWDRAGVTAPSEGLTLDNILDERGKELFCEGHRRNDMIRFGTFDQPFWGMDQSDMTGVPTPNTIQNTFPLPASAVASNPNLELDPQ